MNAFFQAKDFQVGELEGKKDLTYTFCAVNSERHIELLARTWVSLLVALGTKKSEKIDPEKENQFQQEKENPLLLVDYQHCTGSLGNRVQPVVLREMALHKFEIAFKILRVSKVCLCSFGALVMYGLNIQTGIVADFGIKFSTDEEIASYTKRATTANFGSVENPQTVSIEFVYKGMTAYRINASPLHVAQNINIGLEQLKDMVPETAFLQNIVLVGTNPADSDQIQESLSKLLPQHKINVFQPPNSATAIWEGASKFAFTTHANPGYQTDFINGLNGQKWVSLRSYKEFVHNRKKKEVREERDRKQLLVKMHSNK